ncbi:hypothetical protein [Vibrio phage vB_VpaM_XM1]
MKSKQFKAALSIGFVFSVMLAAGNVDTQDRERSLSNYCEMVSLWESQERAGINKFDRAGHPNYKQINCN